MATTQNTKIGTTGTIEQVVHNRDGDVTITRAYRVVESSDELAAGVYRVLFTDESAKLLGHVGFVRL